MLKISYEHTAKTGHYHDLSHKARWVKAGEDKGFFAGERGRLYKKVLLAVRKEYGLALGMEKPALAILTDDLAQRLTEVYLLQDDPSYGTNAEEVKHAKELHAELREIITLLDRISHKPKPGSKTEAESGPAKEKPDANAKWVSAAAERFGIKPPRTGSQG